MMYVQVVVGFVILIGGAELLVRGAVSLADRMGVSPLVIGMTVVAFGTSAPELVVTIDAVNAGAAGLAIGNIVGSSIANVLLILGATVLVRPIIEETSASKLDGAVLTIGNLLFAALCLYGPLDWVSGILLLIGFFAFLASTYWRDTHDPTVAEEIIEEVTELEGDHRPLWMSIVFVIAGLAGLAFGADMLVKGGVEVARTFDVSEEVIGLTLFAIGTSLPELAASGIAALRGHPDVAIGNVVGSNMFNILGVGGVAAMIDVIPVARQVVIFDIWVMLAASAFMIPILVWGWRILRPAGVVLLIFYGAYIWAQTYGVEKLMASIG